MRISSILFILIHLIASTSIADSKIIAFTPSLTPQGPPLASLGTQRPRNKNETPDTAERTPRVVGANPMRVGLSWDAQLEFGGGFALRDSLEFPLFARPRLGVLFAWEPWLFAAGVTGEFGGTVKEAVGFQLDAIHLESGISIETGAAYEPKDNFNIHVSLGFTLVGIEWQHRFDTQPVDGLLFKLRLPIGAYFFLRSH